MEQATITLTSAGNQSAVNHVLNCIDDTACGRLPSYSWVVITATGMHLYFKQPPETRKNLTDPTWLWKRSMKVNVLFGR